MKKTNLRMLIWVLAALPLVAAGAGDARLEAANADTPRRRFLRHFIHGMCEELAIGSANGLITAALGGGGEFAIRPPRSHSFTNAPVRVERDKPREIHNAVEGNKTGEKK